MTIWRLAIIAIIFFWLGMNALLIRRTYFPDNGGQQEVKPSLVLQRFAQHTDYINNLNLMRGKEKFGPRHHLRQALARGGNPHPTRLRDQRRRHDTG